MHLERRHLLFAAAIACASFVGSLLYYGGVSVEEIADPGAEFSARDGRSALRVADDLIVASAAFATERGLALAALSASEPIDPARRVALLERRMLADAAVVQVRKHLAVLPSTVVRDRIVARIDAAYEKMALQRSEIDVEVQRPAGQRTVLAISRSFEMPTAVISGMQELLRAIHLDFKATSQGIASWLEIQRLSLEMAEHAGRERAQVAIFLSAAGRAARQQLTLAEYNRHQAVYAWAQVQSALAGVAPRQDMIEKAQIVERRYFAPHDRTRHVLLNAIQHPEVQPMTAVEWFQQATLAIDAMIEFGRDAGTIAAQDLSRDM
jgi:nitrate/nitrite sensing protein